MFNRNAFPLWPACLSQDTSVLVEILLSFNCTVAPLHYPEDEFSARGNLQIHYKYHYVDKNKNCRTQCVYITGKKSPMTLKIIPKRPKVINPRAKVQKRWCRVKRNVFQAVKANATFNVNSLRDKDHSPQAEKFCGLTRNKRNDSHLWTRILKVFGPGWTKYSYHCTGTVCMRLTESRNV